MLDGFAVGVGFGELLGGAPDVRTHVLELGCHLLLKRELLEIDGVVRVGGDGRVGVFLPCVGLGPADDDLETMVLDSAGERFGETLLGDERFHRFFHVLAQAVHCCITLISAQLRCEKLVNDRIILCFHKTAFRRD